MKKNSKVLIVEIIVIIMAILGITLALTFIMDSIGITVNSANLAVTYTGTTTLPSNSLVPVADSVATYNTINTNVLKVDFSVKGAGTNPSDKDIIYDIRLEDLNISCYLKNTYLKWKLFKNGSALTEGSFSPTFDTMEDNKLYLTTTQQDLPSSSGTADSYQLLIWISEACTSSDITQCTSSQDQSDMLGNTISGKVQTILYTDSKKTLTRTTGSALTCPPARDTSGANSPDLVQGLIPVTYDETDGWVKADSTNKKTTWYNYEYKRWANAVLVSDTNRSTYQSATVGTPIPESDVLAYYVWIPRYKYKVWNIAKSTSMTNNLNARTQGIDIEFERERASTGTIKCTNYSFAAPTSTTTNETCSGSNGEYYTHPAFTFGNQEVRGIWVGKYEISSSTPTATDGGGNSTSLTVRTKPNTTSWRGNTLTNFYKVIYDMQIANNIYGLNTSRSNTDSHMLKNMEWGAVAYLTNSKYGRCSNNTCTEVTINNSSDYITGNAGSTVPASYASGITNAYDTAAGQLASTTGNIYGIYDISGGSYEYVMGNMSSTAGSYTYYPDNAGSNYTYTGNEKYVDTYANGSTNSDQTAYNRSRLGDATGETKSWYSDYAYFVYSLDSWFCRGGNYSNTTSAGPFLMYNSDGNSFNSGSARSALLSTSN